MSWKKAFESDIEYIVTEMKEGIGKPAVIILTGPLGAGKTTFTKHFVGANAQVQSPTYSLVNEIGNIAHADFYRINDPAEIVHLELMMYLEEKEYFLVEWGKSYLKEIMDEAGDAFYYYELEIEINDLNHEEIGTNVSRNYYLKEL
jgi:tRNA threonylcarbamoyladenosine biosynthesis protein TsaE